jgi:haloacetate dehalogenase
MGHLAEAFDGFTTFDIPTRDTTIHGVTGGSGPPVLLLHGIPETHLMWHRVAHTLAERFTVVAADLRGYGASGTPPSTDGLEPCSMREIGREQVELMGRLGHERFAVVGHDRGARCAYRMALDHPAAIDRLAVLDIVPTGDTIDRAGPEFALAFWVWSFLAAPHPLPETLVAAAPDLVVGHMLDAWAGDGFAFPDDVRAAYVAPFRDPATVHAICQEYRAAHSLDAAHDRADREAGVRIECPVLALWSGAGTVASWFDPLAVWREWADDVRGAAVDSGHFLPEEAPDEVVDHLLPFLTGPAE